MALIALITILARSFYIARTLVLWTSPDVIFRFAGIFVLCLAMIDKVSARRADPVLFYCDNLLLAICCIMLPVTFWQQGNSSENVALMSFTTFAYYMTCATGVPHTRETLSIAQFSRADSA
jgi:hypothetical protein